MFKKLMLLVTAAVMAVALAAPAVSQAMLWGGEVTIEEVTYPVGTTPVPITLKGSLTESSTKAGLTIGPCSYTMQGSIWNVEREEVLEARGKITSVALSANCPLANKEKTLCTQSWAGNWWNLNIPIIGTEPGGFQMGTTGGWGSPNSFAINHKFEACGWLPIEARGPMMGGTWQNSGQSITFANDSGLWWGPTAPVELSGKLTMSPPGITLE